MKDKEKYELAKKYEGLIANTVRNNTMLATNFERERYDGHIEEADKTVGDQINKMSRLVNTWLHHRPLMDFQTGEKFVMQGPGYKLTDQFKEFVGSGNIEYTLAGEISPYNFLTVAGKEVPDYRFADAYVIHAKDVDNNKANTILMPRASSYVGTVTNPAKLYNIDDGRINPTFVSQEINKAYTTFNRTPGILQKVNILGEELEGTADIEVLPDGQVIDKGILVRFPDTPKDAKLRHFPNEKSMLMWMINNSLIEDGADPVIHATIMQDLTRYMPAREVRQF
jgi:hypothetical protein